MAHAHRDIPPTWGQLKAPTPSSWPHPHKASSFWRRGSYVTLVFDIYAATVRTERKLRNCITSVSHWRTWRCRRLCRLELVSLSIRRSTTLVLGAELASKWLLIPWKGHLVACGHGRHGTVWTFPIHTRREGLWHSKTVKTLHGSNTSKYCFTSISISDWKEISTKV